MGMIASYLVASAEEAAGIDPAVGPEGALRAVDGPAFLPTDLDGLAERLGVGSSATIVIASTDATWLFRLEDGFIRAVGALPEAIDDDAADRYQLSTEEVDLIESVLRPLAIEAASRQDQAIYEWISL